MKIKKNKDIGAYIPTASMADIAFLLIIFFMVTTVFQVDKTSVNLPLSSERSREIPRGAAFVVLAKLKQGATEELVYKFSAGADTSGLVPSPSELYFEILNVTNNNPLHTFVVKIDKTVKYQLVDEILDTLKRAGAQDLILMTEQLTLK